MTEKKKIAIIGANSFQNPLILKAKEMGYETHVFAWEAGDVGERTADVFHPVSIVEKDEILEKCRETGVSGVATIASDLANITVQYVSERLGLPHNSARCIEISTNKYEMRKALREGGVDVPAFVKVSPGFDMNLIKDFRYPLIVKPTDRSGSRSIMKIESPDAAYLIPDAVKNAAESSFENAAIIEEYIAGEEYSCEAVSFEGEHHVLTVTKKFTTGAPRFIETGHIEPAGLTEEMYEKVKNTVTRALTALEIRQGASHSEFKIRPDGSVGIIEIGSRMGGDCIGSHLVPLSTGFDFVGAVLKCAVGEKPEIPEKFENNSAAIRFIFGREDLGILEEIKKTDPESVVFVSEIEDMPEGGIVDSGSRPGYYIVKDESRDSLLRKLKFKE